MTVRTFQLGNVSDLLQRPVSESGTLSLWTAPLHVFVEEQGGQTGYAALIDAALDRRGLMDLLFEVAPYKAHGPDRFARVLDNWALLDRAKTSSTSESLMLQHARRLKSSWDGFVAHRQAFVEVLQDATGAQRLVPLLSWSKAADGARRWQSDVPEAASSHAAESAGGRGDSLAGLVTVPYFLPELRRGWRAWQPLVRGEKSNYIGPASVPVLVLMHRRALLNSALCRAIEDCVSARVSS